MCNIHKKKIMLLFHTWFLETLFDPSVQKIADAFIYLSYSPFQWLDGPGTSRRNPAGPHVSPYPDAGSYLPATVFRAGWGRADVGVFRACDAVLLALRGDTLYGGYTQRNDQYVHKLTWISQWPSLCMLVCTK